MDREDKMCGLLYDLWEGMRSISRQDRGGPKFIFEDRYKIGINVYSEEKARVMYNAKEMATDRYLEKHGHE